MKIPVITPADVQALNVESAPCPLLPDNPAFKPFRMASEKPGVLYGVELEFNDVGATDVFRRRLASYQRSRGLDFFFCKYDGSLRDGVEVVTHPFSSAWFRSNREHFRNLLTIAYESGAKVGSRAGLHVHVSRKGLKERTKACLFHFVNESANRSLVARVAGREPGQAFGYYPGDTLLSREGVARMENKTGKYEAVNFKHADTIEIRIFKSTTKTANLYARVQFAFAAVAFCRATPAVDCTATKFREFVASQSERYDALCELLRDDEAM